MTTTAVITTAQMLKTASEMSEVLEAMSESFNWWIVNERLITFLPAAMRGRDRSEHDQALGQLAPPQAY